MSSASLTVSVAQHEQPAAVASADKPLYDPRTVALLDGPIAATLIRLAAPNMLVMLAQIGTRGYLPNTMRRFLCFALFWHALDIIWVALFTVVYLMGAAA